MHCKKSCDNCGPCRDESLNCPKRYDYYACVGNANFALRECKAVCEICKPGMGMNNWLPYTYLGPSMFDFKGS